MQDLQSTLSQEFRSSMTQSQAWQAKHVPPWWRSGGGAWASWCRSCAPWTTGCAPCGSLTWPSQIPLPARRLLLLVTCGSAKKPKHEQSRQDKGKWSRGRERSKMIGSAARRRKTRRKGSLGSYRRRRSVRNARVSGVTMLRGLGLYKRGAFSNAHFQIGLEFSPLVAHQTGSLQPTRRLFIGLPMEGLTCI